MKKTIRPGYTTEGLSWNKCCIKALRFRLDLVNLIEQNRRNSSNYFEDFAIED